MFMACFFMYVRPPQAAGAWNNFPGHKLATKCPGEALFGKELNSGKAAGKITTRANLKNQLLSDLQDRVLKPFI